MPENRVSWGKIEFQGEKIEFWIFWQNRVSLKTHKKACTAAFFIQPFCGNERNWIFRNLEFSREFLEFSEKILEFREKFLEFSRKILEFREKLLI